MDRGAARAALVIPSGFARSVSRGEEADLEIIINGDNANTVATVMGYASTVVRTESDPLGYVRYEAHHYFDSDPSGTYRKSYAEELAAAQAAGW